MQRRIYSLLEACANTGIGMTAHPVQYGAATGIFTAISIARGYVVRRWANYLQFRYRPHRHAAVREAARSITKE